MATVDPSALFSASIAAGVSGLVGTLAVQIVNPGEGEVLSPRTTAGIAEFPAGSGIYGVQLTAPVAPGLYTILWDKGLGFAPADTYTDALTVNATAPEAYGMEWTGTGWVVGGLDSDQYPDQGASGSNPIPVAADVRAASQLDMRAQGYAKDTGPAGLQEVVDRATSAFWRITGQKIDTITPEDAPLVRRVIMGMTEQIILQSNDDVLQTQADWDLLQSFSAGSYSEQHRDPGAGFKARMLNPVPWISDALWTLLTEERYGHYISFFTGTNVPAFAVTDTFWEQGGIVGEMDSPYFRGFGW